MKKKYIGVDFGAWRSKKTSIAVIVENDDRLILEDVTSEPLGKSVDDYRERDKGLIDFLISLAGNNATLAIDAPFAIPSALKENKLEKFYEQTKKSTKKYVSIQNQYLFDNSARFLLDEVDEIVLAPCATLVGAYTARMAHLFSMKEFLSLNPIVDPSYDIGTDLIKTIEVFPRATLKILGLEEIPQYKNNNFSKKREEMIFLLQKYVILDETKIKTDDDFDAVVCALTAYFVDRYGYAKPASTDMDKFTNSFIYIPKIEE